VSNVLPQNNLLLVTNATEYFQVIGMILIGWGFFRVSRHPWLLQRQGVHLLLVISNDGLDLYSKAFRPEITQTAISLLTGALSAVSALFQEATKSESQVQAILFEGKELRIVKRERFACAILVDYSTSASESALQRFTERFEEMFQDNISDFGGNVSQFKAADPIAEEYFS
jgi:ethanolamine utilization microcompartment shell protein EutS